MKKLSHEQVKDTKPSVEEVKLKKRNPIYVLLDNIRSLHNVGAIFRTCDAALIKKLYLCGITGTPPRAEIKKTSLGAAEVVPWEYRDDASELIEELKGKGVQIVAVEIAHDAVDYSKFEYDYPVCIVLGHEVHGISDDVMEIVDNSVYIPMLGRANSLNVSTCCGIVVYEALRNLKNSG